MKRDVTEIKSSIDLTAMFGMLQIKMTSTHKKQVLYYVTEYTGATWEKVGYSASDYILEDFKETIEHKEMLDILTQATKKYGY